MTVTKKISPAMAFLLLDRKLLGDALVWLEAWTHREVEVRDGECWFINTSRADSNLGSCSINLDTGAFNDFGCPDFSGAGMVKLHSLLMGIEEYQSFEQLQNAQLPSSRTCTPSAPHNKPVKAAILTEPALVDTADALAPMDIHPQLGMVSSGWEYKTADGRAVAFVVSRFDTDDGKKETRPQSWSHDKQAWVWQFPVGMLPVYNLDAITSRVGATILVNEGEKAADAAQRQFPDTVAITSSQGANNAHKSDWSVLAGRDVVICPDADEAGTGYALAVIGQALVYSATSIRVKDTLSIGWEVGADLADHEVEASFLDDAQPYDQFYQVKQYEAEVFKAAALLPDSECDRQVDRLSKLLGIKRVTFNRMVKACKNAAQLEEVEVESDLVVDDPEPWNDEVDGLQLFRDIKGLIHKHVQLKPQQATTVATWVFYSFCFAQLRVSPVLLLTSATKRCGKSTLMECVSGLVSRPLPVSNISAAAIYRVIEAAHPTLLIDEADTFLSANDEVAGILNSGHTKQMAFVVRIEKGTDGEMIPKKFSTFCPKVVGMIGLPKSGALLDRCVMIGLERAVQGVTIQPLPPEVDSAFLDYRRKVRRWAQDNADEVVLDFKLLPRGSNDRSQNNWSVLASTAKAIHPEVLAEIETAYVGMSGETDDAVDDLSQNLLAALFEIALQRVKPEGMRQLAAKPDEPLANNACLLLTEYLVVELLKMNHEAWASKQYDLNAHKLGKLLSPFRLKSERGRIKYEPHAKRGYRIGKLIPIWQRYGVGIDVMYPSVGGQDGN